MTVAYVEYGDASCIGCECTEHADDKQDLSELQ